MDRLDGYLLFWFSKEEEQLDDIEVLLIIDANE